MAKTDVAMIKEIGRNLDRFAGEVIRRKVMEGSEQITTTSSKSEISEWVKGVMERLDTLVDEKTRIQVMEYCGYNCAHVNKSVLEQAKARRIKYKSIDEFLEAEQHKPTQGTRLIREGEILYHFYTPSSFIPPMRCVCSLLSGLPDDERISPTYCHCSKGFVKKLWEDVLERPVKVELLESVMSGAQECKFAIHL